MTIPEEHHRDHLTGFWRADVFYKHLDEIISSRRLQEEKEPFSLLVLDIDRFKEINDKHGHLCGDKAIKFFSLKIRNACEKAYPNTFFPVRYGGDEIVIVLDKVKAEGVKDFASYLLKDIENSKFAFQDEEMSLEVSIGISSYPDDSVQSGDLFQKADRALYLSKKLKNNKVVLARNAARLSLMLKLKKFFLYACVAALLGGAIYAGYMFIRGPMVPVVITLKSGGEVMGRMIAEDETSIVLRPSHLKGKAQTVIPKENILEVKRRF